MLPANRVNKYHVHFAIISGKSSLPYASDALEQLMLKGVYVVFCCQLGPPRNLTKSSGLDST